MEEQLIIRGADSRYMPSQGTSEGTTSCCGLARGTEYASAAGVLGERPAPQASSVISSVDLQPPRALRLKIFGTWVKAGKYDSIQSPLLELPEASNRITMALTLR
ncbi:hypothetical protein I7I51_00353 [Histoplasma capsulatum]|uniref:Uncharacterized protein n=1 Tax=Ajellomyces capsulatus TaxID=5037 RepID=A0A8A1M9V5_AJECA|nr:hypothetical protein I7I51_00353 [Histoplasma capsulatum]